MVTNYPITVSWLYAGGRQTWARPSQLLTSFGTKALVDFGLAHVVTYGAVFGFINISL